MTLRVLVACEYSGRVRDAFRRHGHKERSRTYEGVAQAMADQWGAGPLPEVAWQPLLVEVPA